VEVRVNGQRFCQEALMLSVVNARPYLARGLADGVLEDGQFNLYLVEPMARWRVLKSVISRKGWFAQRDVLRLKAARMTVTLTRPAHGQTDGSLLPPTPFYDLQVLPSRISLIVPPTARPVADRVITTSSRGFMAETMRVSA
jgi:diacylglycerol kinase family enzyme